LLGPLSETISNVSARASALADENIAGATIVPAAAPVTVLRKSRRFMVMLSNTQGFGWIVHRKVCARSKHASIMSQGIE
jgi:hypothetical protein